MIRLTSKRMLKYTNNLKYYVSRISACRTKKMFWYKTLSKQNSHLTNKSVWDSNSKTKSIKSTVFIINSLQNMQGYMMTITKKLLRFKCYKRTLNKWQKIT